MRGDKYQLKGEVFYRSGRSMRSAGKPTPPSTHPDAKDREAPHGAGDPRAVYGLSRGLRT